MPAVVSRFAKIAAIAVLTGATVFASIGEADARRAGGSGFGSRGTRTFQAPPVTRTAPSPAAPIERSMTPGQQTNAPYGTQQPATAQRPGGFFGGGFGRSMIGGLVAGGLLGMLLGHGFGGGFGFLGMLLQIALIAIAGSFAMRYFANRRQPSYGSAASAPSYNTKPSAGSSFTIPSIGSGAGYGQTQANSGPSDEIGIKQNDLDRFEGLLTEVQTAYGSEDYPTLRRLTTPEAMSYLAEELGENATNGVRNQVTDVKLLQGDIAEAWREDGSDYATLAMRYSSVDALVERTSGRVVSGDNRTPTETTEVWTFVRKPGNEWKLAAIQGTEQRAA